MKTIDADKLIQVLEKRFNNCMEGYKKTGEKGWLHLAQAYNMVLFEAEKLIYDINEDGGEFMDRKIDLESILLIAERMDIMIHLLEPSPLVDKLVNHSRQLIVGLKKAILDMGLNIKNRG